MKGLRMFIFCLSFCSFSLFILVPLSHAKTPDQIRAEQAAKKEAKKQACIELEKKQQKELEGENQPTRNALKPYHDLEKQNLNCNPKKAPKTIPVSKPAPMQKQEKTEKFTPEAIEKFESQVAP